MEGQERILLITARRRTQAKMYLDLTMHKAWLQVRERDLALCLLL